MADTLPPKGTSPLTPAVKAGPAARLSRRGRWLIAAGALSLAVWAALALLVMKLS